MSNNHQLLRDRALNIAVLLLQSANAAGVLNYDYTNKIFKTRHILLDEELENPANYPYVVVQTDGTGFDEQAFAQFQTELSLRVIAYHRIEFVVDHDDPGLLDDSDIVTRLWSDMLTAINPATSSDRLVPDSSVEDAAERGRSACSVSLDYTAKFTHCFEEPTWLTPALQQQIQNL